MENSPSSDERTMAMVCHLAAFAGVVIPFGNIIGPLVVWLLKKDSSPYIDYHGKEALNFQIAATVYTLVAILSMMVLIGFVLAPVVGIAVLVLTIIAAIKAKNGEQYRYPYIFRLL